MSSGNFQKAFLNNFTIFITLKGNKIILHHLLCIWSVDKKQIRQTQCMELFIVTYQGGVLLPRNVIDGLQPLESNKYQVEFDPRKRELVSTCEKIKVLHKIIINLH